MTKFTFTLEDTLKIKKLFRSRPNFKCAKVELLFKAKKVLLHSVLKLQKMWLLMRKFKNGNFIRF